ncbi:MAG: phosphate ABC transporter permease PstA [Actinomycetota bacterium]|nr:phosphate ABC transporter permease PstA [Actinomycetota bacterium]MDP3630568.1 phosphate ABC transporter permease PstA [Actinomycetota bacterium]
MSNRTGRARRARVVEGVMKVVTGACVAMVIGAALFVLGKIIVAGLPGISLEFLFSKPGMGMRAGGIFPVIMGTLMLVTLTGVLVLPLGVMAGIYLSEYAPKNLMTRIVRLSIANMAGVPSIVYGLFGLAVFVLLMQIGKSLLASALTLTCLTLPVIITTTEEALRQIPADLRQAALALGATRWRAISKVVLPAAAPGIVTGSILGLSRAAGETAPILVTGAAFFLPKLPDSVTSQYMSLPYHLYVLATQVPNVPPEITWGTAFVLVVGVSIVSMFAAAWRSAQRKKVKW